MVVRRLRVGIARFHFRTCAGRELPCCLAFSRNTAAAEARYKLRKWFVLGRSLHGYETVIKLYTSLHNTCLRHFYAGSPRHGRPKHYALPRVTGSVPSSIGGQASRQKSVAAT